MEYSTANATIEVVNKTITPRGTMFTTFNIGTAPIANPDGIEGEEWYETYSTTLIGEVTAEKVIEAMGDDILRASTDELREIAEFLGGDSAKALKKAQISAYDKSEAVNSFIINGVKMWLSLDVRTGLATRMSAELDAGLTTTTLWYGNMPFTLPLKEAKKHLAELEVYASQCYDVTARHKAEVEALESIEDVLAYDITKDYPQMLDVTM